MPVMLELFCGRGGWTKAAQDTGWTCVGFDNAPMDYPGCFILQELPTAWENLTFLKPDLIVASPPCEQYARRHLPWIQDQCPIDERLLRWSLSLIGRGIPVIIECSRFAARHVQGARFAFPYALWGDLPIILPYQVGKKPDPGGRRIYADARKAEKRAEIPKHLAGFLIDYHDPRRKCT